MFDQSSPDSKVVPLFLGEPGGPLVALSEYRRSTKEMDGRTVTFHSGKDPVSCREAMLRRFRALVDGAATSGLAGTLRKAGAALDPESYWRDVRCDTFVNYCQGNRQGVLATWDSEGRKQYWGKYLRDQRHEFCCLFKNDRPAIVVVFDRGEVRGVHLIAGGKVARSFASEEEAQRDGEARRLLDDVNEFESRFKRNERAFEAQIRKAVQTRIGEINKWRRSMEQSRRTSRDAKQKENFNNLRKTAIGQ
jgi:hypothetical protein